MASSESAGLITKADAPEPAGAALARWRVLASAALAMLLVGCGASMLTFLYAMDDEQARVSIKVATGISATQYSLLAGYTQGGAALLSQLAIGFLLPKRRGPARLNLHGRDTAQPRQNPPGGIRRASKQKKRDETPPTPSPHY